MAGGIPKAQLMNGEGIQRALTRMAHEIMEQLAPLDNVVLVGIRRRGVPLAQRLAAEGVSAARRTVAKYRQALGLPPAHGRRR